MKVLDADTVRSRVSLAAARGAVHDAFCALAEGDVVAPDEFAMHLANGGELHVKGAHLGGPYLAFKAAAVRISVSQPPSSRPTGNPTAR
ncbi:MAG: hypothetical protein EBZ17_14670 [Actinobacteria bacterium]|nr:hypothetical protein [Actinomycetota bacterium]